MFASCISLLLAASAQVWVEPSWVDVLDGDTRSRHAGRKARIDLARGEWAAFQVVVSAGDERLEGVELVAPDLPGLPPPALYRVGLVEVGRPSGRSWGSARYRPDPLLPALPVHLAPDSYAVFWVLYHAPPEAVPRGHRATVEVRAQGRKRPWRLPLTCTVHPFTPPTAPLAVYGAVDAAALRDVLGWAGPGGPDEFRAVHQFFAAFGIVPALADPASTGLLSAFGTWDGAGAALGTLAGARVALGGIPVGGDVSGWDAVAVSLPSWSIELSQALASGAALREQPAVDAAVSVQPTGGPPLAAALDGSPHTVWEQAQAVPRTTVELFFPEPVLLERVALSWLRGREAEVLAVDTAREGSPHSSARTRWDLRPADYVYGQTLAMGTLRYPQPASSLRITLGPNPAGRPLALAEIRINPGEEAPAEEETAATAARALWLRVAADAFPSLSPDAHPAEARVLPWLCDAHRFAGLVLPMAAVFPRAWAGGAGAPPLVWALPADAEAPLCYPAGGTLHPSVRLMRLRAGLQDLGWLRLLADAAAAGKVKDRELLALLQARLYNPQPDAEAMAGMLDALLKHRASIARTVARALPRGG